MSRPTTRRPARSPPRTRRSGWPRRTTSAERGAARRTGTTSGEIPLGSPPRGGRASALPPRLAVRTNLDRREAKEHTMKALASKLSVGMALVLGLTTVTLFTAAVADAQTITVDTAANPEATLRPASGPAPLCSPAVSPCAHSGDTVALAPGTYILGRPLDVSIGTATIQGPSSGPGAVLDGHLIAENAFGDTSILVTETGTATTVANLTFTGALDTDAAIKSFGIDRKSVV